jgi:membrane protease YdiL (CAAX protease family)
MTATQVAAAERSRSLSAQGAALTAGLVFAVLAAPFIGGVRGPAVYAGWVLIPLAAGWRELLASFRPAHIRRRIKLVLLCAGLGTLCAGALLLANRLWPALLAFIGALPALHQDMVRGNLALFIALIPFAHFAHELFYRGFLQQRLQERLQSPLQAILFAGVLFTWTHVFVFRQPDILPPSAYMGVIAFTAIESAAAGAIFSRTNSLAAAIAFRAANLIALSCVIFFA